MIHHTRSLIAAGLFGAAFACSPLARAGVVINEFMASNAKTLADEDGNYEDWIELHNPTTAAIDLAGWGLSDDLALPFQWTFAPGTIIAPGGHLLVWASGKNRPGQQSLASQPNQIAGLVTWLRADTATFSNGDPVGTWLDSSGRGNHATQALTGQRPTFATNAINGLPALSFNRASTQQLRLPTTGFQGMADLSNFTFMSVARWTGGVTSGLFGGYRGSNTTNTGSVVFEIGTGSTLRLRVPNPINLSTSAAVTQNQWQILGAAMDGPAAKARTFVNGRTIAEADGTAGLTLLANYERFPIGSSFDDTRTFGGQIAEIAIFNRALSPLERAALESHWARKYNLPAVPVAPGTPPHTNFRISASGEPIVLTRPDGTTANLVGPLALATDLSYGRTLADPAQWTLLATPTPGAANNSLPWQEPPPPVAFSHAPGIHGQSFPLALSHPDPSAIIIYTLDGSEPTTTNLAGTTYQFRTTYNTGALVNLSYQSLTYTAPIPVSDRTPQANKISSITTTSDSNPTYLPATPVKKATVVRARAYVDGRPGPISNATYFVSGTGAFNYNIPLVSLTFNEDSFFDYNKGIYVAGVDHVTSTGGRICNWGNFNRSGSTAERAGNFQLFENGALTFDQGVGFRIHGNCSRRNAFKSMRVQADRIYDPRDELDHPFFDAPPPDATVPGNTTHKRLILRSPSINEVSFSRLYQPIYGGVGGRLRPVVKFFNGEYWGISYLRDRLDEHYLARHYSLDPDNLAVVNIKYGYEVGSTDQRVFDLAAGIPSDMDGFWAMRNFIIGNNMAVTANYEQALALLDTRSFIDHLILKIFAGDDHYAPEYIFWRARDPQDGTFGDGRWRVMVKDFDSSLFTANYVTGLANGTHPRPFGFELFQSLLANPSFRNDFINRFADLLNAHFQPSRFQSIINAAYDEVAPIWNEMSSRWNNVAFSNPPRPFTTTNRDNLINWSTVHPPRQRGHIRSHFAISSDVNLTVNVSNPAHGHVRVNTIDIAGGTPGLASQPYPWTGVYFHNIPVKLSAIPAPGYRFSGWRMNGSAEVHSLSPDLTATLTTATSFEASFQPVSLVHRWEFENSLTFLNPSQTVGGNALLTTTPGPTTEVLRNTAAQDFPTAHLRVNNPLGATLTWALPTTGFGALTLSWETRRSGQGAGIQIVETTTDGSTWQPLASYPVLDAAPQLRTFDLAALANAENNPRFAVRITFAQGTGGTAGNNRFDNVTLTGLPLPGGNPPASIVFETTPAGTASGATLAPIVVRLLDENGLPATSFNGPVTLALSGGGSLTGTLTVNAVNGTATFADLILTGTGAHQLVATAAGLDPAASSTFRSLVLTALIVPQFIQGGQDALAENNERVPFAWRARIDGLAPGATYRFANRAVLPADTATNDGAGNMIFVTGSAENWIRSTAAPRFLPTDLGTGHFTFTAGPDGTFTGWFLTEPSGNSRFTPGNTLQFRLLLNDGNAGQQTAHILTTPETAQVLRFGTASGDGTAIIGQSSAAARSIAILYGETAGTTRPLAATPVEITGAGVDSRYATFYQTLVAISPSHWGTILPNTLPGGLQRIDIRTATAAAALLETRLSANGFSATTNPAGGLTTPILLDAEAGLPIFLPGGSAPWHTAGNWLTGIVPNAPAASAIVNAPTAGDRSVDLNAPTTLGSLRVNQAATPFRNLLHTSDGSGSLTFDSGTPGSPATLRIDGSGSGHVDLDLPATLASDLILLVNQADGGDPTLGALHLQQTWTGPGGLIKQGPGMASLTGTGNSFTGPLFIEQGTLRVTAPAVPTTTSGVTIQPGGQLRLVSTGGVHQFGGGAIHLGGPGPGGALRYDPGTQDNFATLTNPLSLTANADLHIDGSRNTLRLDGQLNGNGHTLAKTGEGTLEIAAASPAPTAPDIHVQAGTLAVNASHLAAVHLAAGTSLTGNGSVATITGPGTVSPGTQTLTATTSTAARIAAVLTTPGTSGNGRLALTAATDPLPTAPQTIDLFLHPTAPPAPGDRFQGGLSVPAGIDLASALAATTVHLFLADPTGEIHHLDTTYRPATAADRLTWSISGTTLEVLQGGTPTAYAQWRNLHFADPAARADDAISGPHASDATGTTNLFRYAFNLGLADPTIPAMPFIDPATATFRFALDPSKSDLAWLVRSSPDLTDWSGILFDSRTTTPPPTTGGLTPIPYPPNLDRLFLRLELLLTE